MFDFFCFTVLYVSILISYSKQIQLPFVLNQGVSRSLKFQVEIHKN